MLDFLSSKTPLLEDEEVILSREEELTQHIPKDNLYFLHQCGFASNDVGNELSVEQQWNNIKQGQALVYYF